MLAFVNQIQNWGQTLQALRKALSDIAVAIGIKPSITENMKRNFDRFGRDLEAKDLRDFDAMARKFYDEGLKSSDPLYSVVLLPKHRCGIDYNGEFRGIYESDGKPLAFFKPNFRELGYSSKDDELKDWRSGANSKYYGDL